MYLKHIRQVSPIKGPPVRPALLGWCAAKHEYQPSKPYGVGDIFCLGSFFLFWSNADSRSPPTATREQLWAERKRPLPVNFPHFP